MTKCPKLLHNITKLTKAVDELSASDSRGYFFGTLCILHWNSLLIVGCTAAMTHMPC